MSERHFRLGVDSGGTFTDFVLVGDGELRVFKVPTDRAEPERTLAQGLEEIVEAIGGSLEDFLARCQAIVYGTTIATNALIQGKGARTALLTTEGHRDSLEIRQGYREERYNFEALPPTVLVPRDRRLPVPERTDKDGSVSLPLDEDALRDRLAQLREDDVEAVAISFLYSFLAPGHERRAAEIAAEVLPDAYVSHSSTVLPRIREYDRTSTTVLNAYLGPAVVGHLDRIEGLLAERGFDSRLRVLQANAGCASPVTVRDLPIGALNSGPAAAPAAARTVAGGLDLPNLISVDMGGTSFDVSLVEGGNADMVTTSEVCGYRTGLPMVNVRTLGAGGGSIAAVGADGLLHVGPESAEAVPGPACYGRGGVRPTVTDANLVLGYLSPEGLLGGRFPLDREAAVTAIETVAQPIGLTVEEAAAGIIAVVDQAMVGGISEVSVERGYDPREFALVVGGGSGALHAERLAHRLGIELVLIPRFASVYCAYGAVVGTLRYDNTASYGVPTLLEDVDLELLGNRLDRLREEGLASLSLDAAPAESATVRRWAELRYRGQIHECAVAIPEGETTAALIAELAERFHDRHETLYAFAERESPCELINLGVSVESPVEPLPAIRGGGGAKADAALTGMRRAWVDGDVSRPQDVPVYDGSRLRIGASIAGPALIEEATTTIVVSREAKVELLEGHIYALRLGAASVEPQEEGGRVE